jgi:hypothetical protein
MRTTTGGTRCAAAIAVALAISGCRLGDTGVPPINDSQTFDLPGHLLTVDSTSDLRLVPGGQRGLTVSREFTGMAAEEGNASWTLEGDTLKLTATCSGLVIECGSLYTVAVPAGVAVSVTAEGAEVTSDSLPNDLTVRTRTGHILATRNSGTLRLTTETGDVTVDECGSSDVEVHSQDADHTLAFRTAPRRVAASTRTGDISLALPADDTPYLIDASAQSEDKYHVEVPNSPNAANQVTVGSPGGRVRIAKGGR